MIFSTGLQDGPDSGQNRPKAMEFIRKSDITCIGWSNFVPLNRVPPRLKQLIAAAKEAGSVLKLSTLMSWPGIAYTPT